MLYWSSSNESLLLLLLLLLVFMCVCGVAQKSELIFKTICKKWHRKKKGKIVRAIVVSFICWPFLFVRLRLNITRIIQAVCILYFASRLQDNRASSFSSFISLFTELFACLFDNALLLCFRLV